MTDNINKFDKSREEVINFFRDYIEMLSDTNYDAKQNETKGTGLKILTPKQMLQRLPIALAQVKGKLFILCISLNKSLKRYTIT